MRISDWSSDVCSSDLVDDVRAESFPRNLERQQRSGAVFEKGVHLGETGQPIIMFGRLPVDRHPMLRLIQQEADFPWLKIFHAQQMPVRKIVATGKPGLAHSGLHGCGLLQKLGKLKWGKRDMPDTPPQEMSFSRTGRQSLLAGYNWPPACRPTHCGGRDWHRRR